MSKEKILVIEDDANLREAICTFIEINGLDFVSAANGKEGLLCLTSQVVDMVVCDINLPDVLGWEILKAVRNDPRIYNIPFIFLSAYADKKDVNKGLELGADEYITKPFSNKELIETIFFWLKRAKRDDNLLAQDLNARVLNLIGRNMSHDIIEPLFGLLSEGRVLNQYQGLPAHNHLAETDVINHQMNSILSIYASGFHIQRDLNNYVTYESLVNSKTKELVNDKFTVNLDLAVLLNKIVATYNTIYNQEMLAVEQGAIERAIPMALEEFYARMLTRSLVSHRWRPAASTAAA